MHWEILIIPLIAFAVWVLSSLFKETEEPGKGRPRQGSASPGPRRGPAEIDRFLAQRRQRRTPDGGSAERAGEPVAQPEQSRPRPSREQPRSPGERRQPGSRPPTAREAGPTKPPAAPPRLLADQPAPAPAKPAPAAKLELPRAPTVPVAQPVAATAGPVPEVPVSGLQRPSIVPTVTVKEQSLPPLGQLLRSPQSARLAFILREIINPPLCRRPRNPQSR